MTNSALEIVQRWHDLLNMGQVEPMVALVHADVELGGPRGSTSGVQVVREWFGRANARFIPLQWFGQGDVVVVEQRGEWLSDSDDVTSTQVVVTVFAVHDGLITRIMRYDNLQTALETAGLNHADKID